MPKILFVDNDAGTFLSHRAALCGAFRDIGHDVHIAVPNAWPRQIPELWGTTTHRYLLTRSGSEPGRELKSIGSLCELYRRLKPEVVQHLRLKPIVYGTIAAKLSGVPNVINSVTGLGYLYSRNTAMSRVQRTVMESTLRGFSWNLNTITVFQNPEDRAIFVKRRVVSAETARIVLGSGVDTAHFVALPEPPGKTVVLLAARMLFDKGIEQFVKAARSLKARHPEIVLALAGGPDSGNPRCISEEQLRVWHDEGVVEWWGNVPDVRKAIARCHIVCLPSLYREGIPRVLLEAAACQRALIATDMPGCREIVRHNSTGLLVKTNDVPSLVEAILELTYDDELRRRLAISARALCVSQFDIRIVIEQMKIIHGEILSRSNDMVLAAGV